MKRRIPRRDFARDTARSFTTFKMTLNLKFITHNSKPNKMKTLLIAIGKTDNKYLTAALDDYLGRANHYAPIETPALCTSVS